MGKSWFCLNTPFAETAENQLKYDMEKLESWFRQMIHPELPARISNGTLAQALRFANAYSWEFYSNSEYSSDSSLIFIGDFANNSEKIQDKGTLYCKTVPVNETKNRFFAFEFPISDGIEIPYIVVDSFCPEKNSLKAMQEYYGWDESIWNELLPLIYVDRKFRTSNIIFEENLKFKLADIDRHLEETDIPDEYRWLVEERIEILKQNEKDKVFMTTFPDGDDPFNDKIAEGTTLDGTWVAECLKTHFNKEHYFALCIHSNDNKLKWYLFSACKNDRIEKTHTYKVGNLNVSVQELLDVRLNYSRASITDFVHFFGRGSVPSNLLEAKIAVIGVGAIGSTLIESLVRSGVCNITVWDGDIVEPGNICRSIFTLADIGKNKATALAERMQSISPFCNIHVNASNLYGDINYESQSNVAAKLDGYDIIFDCTASNELLHFLSYAVPTKLLISLCITNHAQNLLCLSSVNGNVFDQRKTILSAIEQDTNNFYVEGTGCYSPTFLATKSNITMLVDNFLSSFSVRYKNSTPLNSVVYNRGSDAIKEDQLLRFCLKDSSIVLNILDSVMHSAENLPETYDYAIGYLLGGYSEDHKNIYVTHAIASDRAEETLDRIFKLSEGVIDYIGEIHYGNENGSLSHKEILDSLIFKAQDETINTNNPLVMTRKPDGTIVFFLQMGSKLVPFDK